MTVVPFIGFLIIRFVYLTSKKTFHLPTNVPDEPFIVGVWHGDLLMQGLNYKKLRPKMHLKAIISEHTDGQLIAKTFECLGIGAVRGSTRRGGAKVLIQAIGMLKKGSDIAVTPDGPKGPRHTVHNGIVVMAQKTGAKVIFLQCKPSKYWQLKSWDRFTIPKPFGHLEFFASEPVDLSGMDLEEAKSLVKMKLMENHPDGEAT
jgi:lysophospholipid acyltransferase (LPLAT)-like uncharacterized protein